MSRPLLYCQEAEKLDLESKKVFKALKYLRDVVDKEILQQLAGSATIVLETVMETNQLITSFLINQERLVRAWCSEACTHIGSTVVPLIHVIGMPLLASAI